MNVNVIHGHITNCHHISSPVTNIYINYRSAVFCHSLMKAAESCQNVWKTVKFWLVRMNLDEGEYEV